MTGRSSKITCYGDERAVQLFTLGHHPSSTSKSHESRLLTMLLLPLHAVMRSSGSVLAVHAEG
ncbi:hypothetical protein DOTSEDRAFT_75240 [Dothistroma septosporum NZE10]|uniref:Uncharacterized protein n=1 Tax=Dothistroma septosporum (strain NZE10 / CBS 128990) TaxID=675120 RepID=M2Y2I0_DOTSN|nr:hypothetical protein DOTSEDRAFT_75240 [Dothistroma septosporum NZE10]